MDLDRTGQDTTQTWHQGNSYTDFDRPSTDRGRDPDRDDPKDHDHGYWYGTPVDPFLPTDPPCVTHRTERGGRPRHEIVEKYTVVPPSRHMRAEERDLYTPQTEQLWEPLSPGFPTLDLGGRPLRTPCVCSVPIPSRPPGSVTVRERTREENTSPGRVVGDVGPDVRDRRGPTGPPDVTQQPTPADRTRVAGEVVTSRGP